MMTRQKNLLEEPFWVDEPDLLAYSSIKPRRNSIPISIILVASNLLHFGIFILLVSVLGFLFASLFNSTLIGWFVTVGYILIIVFGLVVGSAKRRKMKLSFNQAQLIQARAQELSEASTIGSAIHVAGHPSLARDQPVVLALGGDRLSFFSYASSVPIDMILLRDLQAIHTVVYDDERVPHIDVVDSTALALQLSFMWRGQACQCLFKSMRKKRPIDWFHALQQARASSPATVKQS